MKYVIGADLGTSGTKVVVYDANGNEVAAGYSAYSLFQPQNGYAEQNPLDWKNGVFTAIKQAVSQAKVAAEDVVAIGLSGQMHGLVMLDKDDCVLGNSMIWCDVRAQSECDEIETILPTYRTHTCNAPVVGFTLPKIMWVKKHLPDTYAKIAHILLPKDYINHVLCGGYATDVSDASGTGFFDVQGRCWSRAVCDAFGIRPQWLANVYESCEKIGNLTRQTANELGLTTATVVVAGAGDQAAAGLGNGIVEEGDYSIMLGTSGVVFSAQSAATNAPDGLHCFCHAVPGLWHGMAVTQGAGLSVKWFKDHVAQGKKYDWLDQIAADIKPGSEGLMFLPYLMGERAPHPSATIRGGWIGLSASHTLAHMFRAVIEGVNYSLCECYKLLSAGKKTQRVKVGGGGAKSPVWLGMLADCLGEDLLAQNNAESGTIGAAILAAKGGGVVSDIKEGVRRFVKDDCVKVRCNNENHKKYEALLPLYSELYTLLQAHCEKLF